MQKDKWEFYLDEAPEWRWRRIAANGEIVGAAHEGFNNKADCEENARRNGWEAEDFVILEELQDFPGATYYRYFYHDSKVPRMSIRPLPDDELKEPLWWLNLTGKLAQVKIYRAEPA